MIIDFVGVSTDHIIHHIGMDTNTKTYWRDKVAESWDGAIDLETAEMIDKLEAKLKKKYKEF